MRNVFRKHGVWWPGLAILIFALAQASSFARQILRTPHVPAAVKSLSPLREMDRGQHLRLAIGLPLRSEGDLDELLRQLNDPSSAIFHQWLTPAQFSQRFGASAADYEAVAAFAATNSLTITYQHPNHLVLDVEGSVGDIENAFHTTLRVYPHPTENREFYAPDVEPTLDLDVPILNISGLDNFSIPKPHHKIKPLPSSAVPMAGSGPSGAYMGNDFRAAYVPGSSLTGTGQSVGLLQFDGYYASDITAYESQAGLPNVPLTNIAIDGGVTTPGSGNSEVCLDIEMVMSMAPGISRIYVYEAPNPSPFADLLSRMANDNLSRQLSCSWGGGGVDATSENIFKQMASQGQSFFNATGDSDAFTSSIPFPSDSTNITQVGATTLTTTGPGGSYVSETVWNWGLVNGSYTGSSGGVSTYYGIPSYQTAVSMANNQGSTTKRNVPDVALTGDNVYVRYNNGGSGAFGGTSCAAPLWAGLTALINQQAASNSLPSVGFLNPALYSIGLGPNYLNCFHDTTAGNNFSSSSPAKYSAVTGFDLCTGWGTPVGNALIATLGTPNPILISNSVSIAIESCTNNAVDPNETVTLLFGLKNVGAAGTTNLIATLQASGGVTSPSAAQSYGSIASGGSANRAFTFTANGACGGIITATLQLQDGSANLGTVAFVIHLGYLPVPLVQHFDSVIAPALPSNWSNSVISGTAAAWVTTNSASDTAPNSAFVADAATAGANALVTPSFAIATTNAQLSFAHNFVFESHLQGHTRTYYDGGVLEIKIGSGSFVDILSAGGSFSSGGYNCTLASSTANPYGGRQAWGNSSGGWTTSVVNLPASAAGQSVQLRWVSATDSGNSYTAVGWNVDTISLQDGGYLCCGAVTATPPGITSQPTNQTVILGSNATFQVSATGTAPLKYQWVFASTNIAGATNTVLTLSIVQPSQSGGYKVVVTNIAGTITSAVANLTVLVPPSLTLQPSNTTVVTGSNAVLAAAASGTAPFTYQWYFNGATPVGTNGPNLYLIAVQPSQSGPYQLVVTNSAGSVTSAVANLAVLVPPSISLEPSNTTATAGGSTLFASSASGSTPLTYQWYFNNTVAVGTNGPNLYLSNVQSNQTGPYRLVVTNAAGAATGSVATLTVLVPPSFALQPSNTTVIAGSNALFAASASGSAPLSYQWYFNTSVAVGTNGPNLYLSNVQSNQTGPYRLVVTDAACAATSSVANLTVFVPPSFALQPSNTTLIAGSNALFAASASGSDPLSYQWYFNSAAVGTNGPNLYLSNVQSNQSGPYQLIITNSAGSATSIVANLAVIVPPSFTLQPSNMTAIPGGSVSFFASASASAPVAYQWYFNGTVASGGTSTSLSLTNVQAAQAGSYDVVATNAGGSATSSVAALIILKSPVLLAPSINSTGAFTFILSGDTGQIYSIEASTNLLDWAAIGALSNETGQTPFTDTNTPVPGNQVYRAKLGK